MDDLAILAALHARLRLDAARAAEIAQLGGAHAEAEAADAAILARQAWALETILVERGAIVAAPGQLSLFADRRNA